MQDTNRRIRAKVRIQESRRRLPADIIPINHWKNVAIFAQPGAVPALRVCEMIERVS